MASSPSHTTALRIAPAAYELAESPRWHRAPGRLYGCDIVAGDVGRGCVLAGFDDACPDGLAVDPRGLLWVAVGGAGQAVALDREGPLRGVVDVDAPHTSACTLGGLMPSVTTTWSEVTRRKRRDRPASGALFAARVDGIVA